MTEVRRKRGVCTLAEAFGTGRDPREERLLFVSPHDDDAAIGAGMTIMLAVEAGMEVNVVVVTDGRMGYYREQMVDSIADIRFHETEKAYRALGVKETISRFNLPDGSLWRYIGRRVADRNDPERSYHIGLEDRLTSVLRRVRPTVVLTPALTDIHPDRKAVSMEILISLFHAANGIWPELGRAIPMPMLLEWPTYVAPDGDPEVGIFADDALFEKKLAAIGQWKSQTEIIASLVAAQRAAGPMEFLWRPKVDVYNTNHFAPHFGR